MIIQLQDNIIRVDFMYLHHMFSCDSDKGIVCGSGICIYIYMCVWGFNNCKVGEKELVNAHFNQ